MSRAEAATPVAAADPAALLGAVDELVARARVPRTEKAYGTAQRHYLAWCEVNGLAAGEPATVAMYIAALAGGTADALGPRKASTIRLRLVAIRRYFGLRNEPDPTTDRRVRVAHAAARRALGTRPTKKRPLLLTVLRAEPLPPPGAPLRDVRDVALLKFLAELAARRSEGVALTVDLLRFGPRGVTATIARSKGDQEGRGVDLFVPRGPDPARCAVAALERWFAEARITRGPLFRAVRNGVAARGALSDAWVAKVVKRFVEARGLGDPAEFAGHSLRRGYITAMVIAGQPDRKTRRQSRHKSLAVFEGYVDEATLVAAEQGQEVKRDG